MPGGERVDTLPGYVTPEGVRVELATANVGSRTVAMLVDLVVIAAAASVLGLSFAILGGSGGLTGAFGTPVLLVALLGLLVGYPAGFETVLRGRTPGKVVMGLRVVTREGGPIAFRHAFIRAVFGLVEVQAAGLVAVTSVMVTARSQRLGDLAAGTLVLRERSGHGPAHAAHFAEPHGWERYARSLDVSAVAPAEYEAIRAFLLRRDDLTAEARLRLSSRLAGGVAQRLSPPRPDRLGDEDLLACVATAVQRRGAPRRDTPAPSAAPTRPPPPPPDAPETPSGGFHPPS